MGNTRLIQHQAHEDEHWKSNKYGVLDDTAEETTAVSEELDVSDAGTFELDILVDQFARRIENQFSDQHKDQGNTDQCKGNWHPAKQHNDESYEHRQNHPLVQVHNGAED